MTVYPNKYRDERESKSEPSTTIDKLLQIVLKYQTLLNDQKRSTKKKNKPYDHHQKNWDDKEQKKSPSCRPDHQNHQTIS